MERPWIRSRAGDTAMPAQISAMARIAVTSRAVRPMFKGRDPTRLFEADQAPDDRCCAGFCLRIDAEHDLSRTERRQINAAGRQRTVYAREVVELALGLAAIEFDLLTLASDVEALHHQRAASPGLHDRRGAVQRELGLYRRRSALCDAAQHGGGNLAGFFGRRM